MIKSVVLPPPCQAEPVCVEGIPLLTLSHQLPALNGGGRFNRYYDACCSAFLRTCRADLTPELQSAYRRALEYAAPLPQWKAQLTATLTLQQGQLLSLHTDALITTPQIRRHVRRGDTWDLGRQLPLPLTAFFPRRSRLRHRLCHAAAQQITAWEAEGIARYHPQWRQLLAKQFHPHRFFLGEEGLFFFFPFCSIAPAAEGIPTFFLPYDEEKGPFLPKTAQKDRPG